MEWRSVWVRLLGQLSASGSWLRQAWRGLCCLPEVVPRYSPSSTRSSLKQPLGAGGQWVGTGQPTRAHSSSGERSPGHKQRNPLPRLRKIKQRQLKNITRPPAARSFLSSGPSLWFRGLVNLRTIYCSCLFLKAARSSRTVAHHGDRIAGNRLVSYLVSCFSMCFSMLVLESLHLPGIPQLSPSSPPALRSCTQLPSFA